MDFSLKLCILLLILFVSVKAFPSRSQAVEPAYGYRRLAGLIPCKEDWFLFGEKCYKVGGKAIGLTWEQASLYCSQEEGSLVTIQSQELLDFLITFLLLDVKSNVWIGLHDRETENEYMWEDLSAFNFSKWNSNAKANEKSDCGEMQYFPLEQIGHWEVIDCNMKQAFICQSNKRKKSCNYDPRFCSASKGGGWKFGSSCYHIMKEKRSWREAEEHCQNITGNFIGHLVTIKDATVNLFLNNILSKFREAYWIGIQIEETMHQKWSSGWRSKLNISNVELETLNSDYCLLKVNRIYSLALCSWKFSYVCEISDKPPIEEEWECPGFSDDWKNINGEYCYLFSFKKLKWFEANYECMRKGGALVSIHSREEALTLYQLVVVLRIQERMFIGLHRNYSNIRPKIIAQENEDYADPIPDVIQSSELTTKRCTCPICPNATVQTQKADEDSGLNTFSLACSNITQDNDTAFKLPLNITEIIESAFEEFSCPMQPNIIKIIESALKNQYYPSSNDTMVEDTIQNENESITDEKVSNQTQADLRSESIISNSEQNLTEASRTFIESSVITSEGINKEISHTIILKKKEWPFDMTSGATNALVETEKLRKTPEERTVILQHKTEHHKQVMKLTKEEHELRMNVLKAQLRVLNQISELLEHSPEKIHIIL